MNAAPSALPYVLPLIVIGMAVHAWNLHHQQIENPDEPRYACPARELAEGRSGEGASTWTVPMFNGKPRLVKPVLIYWALGVAGKAGLALGVEPATAFRWVPVLFSLASVLLLFLLGRRLFDERIGFLAALLLLTNYSFHAFGREILIDPMLTALLLGAWYCFAAIVQRLESEPHRTPWAHLLPFYVLLGLAALAKTPQLVAVFAVCPMALYLFWERKRYLPDQGKLGFVAARTGLWWGVPLALAIVASWIAMLHRAGRLDEVLGIMEQQTVQRAMGNVDHNSGDRIFPFIYYVHDLPEHFLPWSLLFIPAFAWLFVGAERNCRRLLWIALAVTAAFLGAAQGAEDFLRAQPAAAWVLSLLFAGSWIACGVARFRERAQRPVSWQAKLLLCAIVVPWALMGVAASKRTLYMLPLYPALSLWLALAWVRVFNADDGAALRKLWSALQGFLAVLAGVGAAAFAVVLVLGLGDRLGIAITFSTGEIGLACVFGVGLAALAVLVLRDFKTGRSADASFQALFSVAALLMAQEAVIRPAQERFENRAEFYAAVAQASGGRTLVMLGTSSNEAVWYLDRPVDDVSMLALKDAFFGTPGAVLLLDEQEYRKKEKLRAAVRKLASIQYGATEYHLVEPDPAHPPDESMFERRGGRERDGAAED
ncbi:MAG: glycosyltransferase family 39 protein [Planctomycetes bacterium]|nr:glycosyltransferase family 39 protein [Planctomycetota bacterium]